MTKAVISPLARVDMQEIGDYIGRELRNPGAALRMIQRFRKTIEPLSKFPEMGAPLLAQGKQNAPYCFLVCGNYMIFYHVENESVMIDRVLYGRRDYMALLFGNQVEDEE